MNVIISNRNQSMLENLGIDIIKDLTGTFTVDEIIATFQNFFYQRMILDITAIKDYTNISNLQKLSISLNMEKVILLLDGTPNTENPTFISNLISMGIYNFAKNFEGIQYLYNTPNTYRDVAQFHNINTNFSQNSVNEAPAVGVAPAITSNSFQPKFSGTRIIGVKNVTKQSGSTSLVYMMKKALSDYYKTVAIEVDKTDFLYFRDSSLISTVTSDIGMVIEKYKSHDVIVVDINNSVVAEGFCNDVLYLIEPSIIKLQKLMTMNAVALQGIRNKKIVLNQSLLSKGEINNFEYESKVRVFYNLSPLNERSNDLEDLKQMLIKLGFNKLK